MSTNAVPESGKHPRGSSSRGSRGFVTIGLALAVAISSFAVLFGSSNPRGVLDLLNGHTWLRNLTGSSPSLSLASDSAARIDFNLTLKGHSSDIAVVQNGRRAVLVDRKLGTVSAINLSRYGLESTSKVKTKGDDLDVVTSGENYFLIARKTGHIEYREGLTSRVLSSVAVGSDLSRGVVDSHGVLWVADTHSAKLRSVEVGRDNRLSPRSSISVGHPGNPLQLGLNGDKPVVLDVGAAELYRTSGSSAEDPVSLDLHTDDRPLLPLDAGTGPIPLSVNTRGVLVLVLPHSDHAQSVQLPGAGGHDLGDPVSFRSRIYVPDYTNGTVAVVNSRGEVQGNPIQTKSTPGAKFDLFDSNGVLYINNPDGGVALQVGRDGVVREMPKNDPSIPDSKDALPPVPVTTAPLAPTTAPVTTPARSSQSSSAPVASAPGSGVGQIATPSTTTAPATQTTAIAASPPDPPLNPTAQAGNKTVSVSWGAPPAHGTPVTGYEVTWTTGTGGKGAQDNIDPTKTGFDLTTGVKNGTTYTFAVIAHSAAGDSQPGPSNTVTPSSDIPDPPTTVSATAQANGSIVVSWNEGDDGHGNPPPAYDVAARGIAAPKTVTGTTSATFTNADGVQLGTSYSFTVQSRTDTGVVSKPSDPSAAVKSHSAPQAVQGLTATQGNGIVTLSWSCTGDCTGGETVTGYSLQLDAGAWQAIGAATTHPVNGLAGGSTHTFKVRATNLVGAGVASAGVTGIPGAPPAVTGFSASAAGDRTIAWTASVDTLGSGAATCHIYLNGGEISQACGGSVGGLAYSTTYDLYATASNAYGTSAQSGHQGPRTNDPPPPPSVSVSQGPTAPLGYRYTITLSNFAANTAVGITCYDTVSPGGFYSFTLTTNGAGSASTSSYCYSADGPNHWVIANGVRSNDAPW